MRSETINTVTWYLIGAALANVLGIWFLFGKPLGTFEAVVFMASLNACYIMIARDLAKKHEILTIQRVHRTRGTN